MFALQVAGPPPLETQPEHGLSVRVLHQERSVSPKARKKRQKSQCERILVRYNSKRISLIAEAPRRIQDLFPEGGEGASSKGKGANPLFFSHQTALN